MSQYVRNGAGSAGKAAKRMGASRSVGKRLLQVIRDIDRVGAAEVLQKLNLTHLAGRPAAEVFIVLLEGMCPPGGRVDEAIARQALLDAVAHLAEIETGTFEEMTAQQLSEFFMDFVIRTIEGRVIADIGKHIVDAPESVVEVEGVMDQLHDFVAGCVHGHLSEHFDGISQKNDQEVSAIVETIYEASFELVSSTAGDLQ
ncbi:Qat anti-phage system associated protein QatB [Pseudoxanthomonas sp. PXM01]|uniref:Qat anti-phage system associated protein QatB n=1 Tax=Pseudoxanthomonas sp. PXM01 TaxID=2769295 RepID=UPI0031BBC80C